MKILLYFFLINIYNIIIVNHPRHKARGLEEKPHKPG